MTPRGELARIRESRERQDGALRSRFMDALLEQCGARGFRAATVQDAIDSCGSNRVQFYRHFASKADCYTDAHEAGIDELCERMLGAGAKAESWQAGLCASLRVLADAIEDRPLHMRGLLVEVHVAGGPSLAKRAETLERLSRAVDRVRRDPDSGHTSPPPLTSAFMVGAIDSAVSRALLRGRPKEFAEAAPTLAQLVIAAYFDQNANDPKELGMLLRATMFA